MSRSSNFNRDSIIAAGLQLVREQGESSLTARALGKMLGCSTSPLFTVCGSFEDIRLEVRKAAIKTFSDYVRDSGSEIGTFKEFAMRLVRYSINEPNLYKMIFLTPEVAETCSGDHAAGHIEALKAEYGISDSDVWFLIDQVWTYANGLSTLCMSGMTSLTEEEISSRLSHQIDSTLLYINSRQAAQQ